MGYQADIAINGQQTLDMCLNRTYNLIILDAGLPDMPGVEVGKRIRILEKNNKANRMPIILLSAYPTNNLKKWCQEAEIDNFSTKPIPYKDLYIMLENIFNQKPVNNEMI
ncbi:response regulator [Rickettsiella endosymbiont of Rhagonycha lignosa]|uniref:response regulator n=1 Tax=Rickettsiella endosymbiont of Rhagonycha lignosa TaxID=3077937 RepID=UPI00313DDBA1